MAASYCLRETSLALLDEAVALVSRVFMEFQAPSYSAAGVREFFDYIAWEALQDKLISGQLIMWSAHELWQGNTSGVMVGYIAFDPQGHICLLFVDKDHHGQGVARSLLNQALAYYAQQGFVGDITVNASCYALEAYKKMGFEAQDVEQTVNGITFTFMKYLKPASGNNNPGQTLKK